METYPGRHMRETCDRNPQNYAAMGTLSVEFPRDQLSYTPAHILEFNSFSTIVKGYDNTTMLNTG